MVTKESKEEILLGVDYGASRIGLAFGRSGVVSPLKIINGKDTESAISDISRVAIETKVDRIVMGLPLNAEGVETPQAKEVRKFAKLLRIKLKKPTSFIDEHLTSKDSVEYMLRMGVSKKKRQQVDHFSAALILKTYYRQQGVE